MWRIRLIFFITLCWFLLIIVRLFYWQVYSHERLLLQAENQHMFRLEMPATRGKIITSDGSPIVTNQIAYIVFAEPKKISDKKFLETKLAAILGEDQASLSAQLKSSLLWVPLKHKVPKELTEEMKRLSLEGIGFEREDIRYYPEGSMSAGLLGFVGSAYDGSPKGYFGLEGYYDRELRGRFGVLRQTKDANGEPILIGLGDRILAENGKTLTLHIDRSIQFLAEDKLRRAVERFEAKGGTVTIMNPKDGSVMAMASYPSYDPSKFSEYPNELYKNPIIADSYEPGSTFKVLVTAAAIEHGLISPETKFQEFAPIEVDGYQIKTWNDKYSGVITTKQILEKSSNVGMVAIANKLGREKMIAAIKNFGFGEPTGVDLEEESSPDLRPNSEWRAIDLATASFGQGIAVTPLQMIRAVAAIANGGKILVPHVAAALTSDHGQRVVIGPKVVRQVFTAQTAKEVTEMMISAVDNGEARYAKPPGYRIAGKTGTAQIPVAGHYDKDKTIASFVGFAPADDPRFIMLVTIREPKTSPWGSETAAPVFFDIAQELFAYFGVHPSQ